MRRLCSPFIVIAALLWISSASAQADMQVWHRSPLDFGVFRYVYDIEILRLALEKTRPT